MKTYKQKRKNYKFEQYKPDTSDIYVEKQIRKGSLFLSQKQIQEYGYTEGHYITEHVQIITLLDKQGKK